MIELTKATPQNGLPNGLTEYPDGISGGEPRVWSATWWRDTTAIELEGHFTPVQLRALADMMDTDCLQAA